MNSTIMNESLKLSDAAGKEKGFAKSVLPYSLQVVLKVKMMLRQAIHLFYLYFDCVLC